MAHWSALKSRGTLSIWSRKTLFHVSLKGLRNSGSFTSSQADIATFISQYNRDTPTALGSNQGGAISKYKSVYETTRRRDETMPEVIDLLSSEPTSPISVRKNGKPAVIAPQGDFLSDDFDFDIGPLPPKSKSTSKEKVVDLNFDLDDDFDFPTKPAKKRKITPPTFNVGHAKISATNRAPPSSIEDDILDLPGPKPKTKTKGISIWEDNADPIEFSSSAPQPASTSKSTRTKGNSEKHQHLSAGFEFDEDGLFGFSQPEQTLNVSSTTASLLASLSQTMTKPRKAASQPRASVLKSKSVSRQCSVLSEDDDLKLDRFATTIGNKKNSKMVDEEKAAKQRDREVAKQEKERQKEQEKEKKRLLKEEKAKEKQLAADLAQVNKAKLDKKISTREMIVDFSSSLKGTSVGNQAVEFMRRMDVRTTFFESPVDGIVRWRREVSARWDEDAGMWKPIPTEIRTEDHVLCFMSAKELVSLAAPGPDEEDDDPLETHVLRIKRKFGGAKSIYLIEGMQTWFRKNKTTQNRAYENAVREQMEAPGNEAPPSNQQATRKRKSTAHQYVDEDLIEDALLQLQLTHGCLIHHSVGASESAEWIKTFTEQISLIPGRQEKLSINDTAFCMDSGQVKSGTDAMDTWVKMLQEVNRLTAPMAYGIATEYPSVVHLFKAFKRSNDPLLLEDVKVSVLLPIQIAVLVLISSTEICE